MVVDSTECIKNHAIPRDRTKPLYLAAHSIANSNTPANRKIKLDSLRASLAAMFLCTETFKSVEALLKRTQSFPFLATDYVLDFFHHSDTLQPKLAVSTPRTTGSSALKLFSQVLPSSGDSLFGPTNPPCFKSFTSTSSLLDSTHCVLSLPIPNELTLTPLRILMSSQWSRLQANKFTEITLKTICLWKRLLCQLRTFQ